MANTIHPNVDGPLKVEGDVEVFAADGSSIMFHSAYQDRRSQYYPFPLGEPAKFQPPYMVATCHIFTDDNLVIFGAALTSICTS